MELELLIALDGMLGSVFSVIIDANKSVDELRKAIIKKIQNGFKDVELDELQLFLAKTESGEWLPDDENLDKLLLNKVDTSKMQQLNMSWKLNNEKLALYGSDVSLGEGVVRVLVKIGLKRPAEDERVGGPIRLKTGDLEATLLDIIRTLEALLLNTLRVFEKLPVSESEFQLDNLSTIRQSGNPIVMTPELHAFWEEFGELLPFYFVRLEEGVF
ncbi:hypothetical protein P3T76_009833 [Phytophthora citrophthora]|uniref:Crinkler effector protein N-terminal domain-containing protein n=1 Tax=Phytophthora citrophthora TaxID=4793 RepID=A0AAD9LHX5_9STRA|nr:hypothetical protein P3T76_009833 [Phytophthora citrophthora]